MGSKVLLAALWLAGTVAAAMVAWTSLSFVSASTEGEVTAPARSESSDIQTATSTSGSPSTPTSQRSTSPPTSTPGVTSTTLSSATSSPSTTSRPDPAVAPTEQTFDLVGGRVAISFTPSEVAVIWATPAPGYTVESSVDDGRVEVEFDNGVRESEIKAWWSDGPRSETVEDDD